MRNVFVVSLFVFVSMTAFVACESASERRLPADEVGDSENKGGGGGGLKTCSKDDARTTEKLLIVMKEYALAEAEVFKEMKQFIFCVEFPQCRLGFLELKARWETLLDDKALSEVLPLTEVGLEEFPDCASNERELFLKVLGVREKNVDKAFQCVGSGYDDCISAGKSPEDCHYKAVDCMDTAVE